MLIASTSSSFSATISGVVTDNNGSPIENSSVSLRVKNGEDWGSAGYLETATDGSFTFNDLSINEYRIKTYTGSGFVDEFYNNVTDEAQAAPISVISIDDNITGIDFNLDALGKISGTVTDTNGQPIGFSRVMLFKYNIDVSIWNRAQTSFIYSNGKYTLDNLKPGRYRLRFGDFNFGDSFNNDSIGGEYYSNAQTLETAADIVVELNDDLIINAVIGDIPTGSIAGKITNSSNIDLADIDISLYLKEGNSWISAGETTTANDGTYRFDQLLADEYRIKAYKYSSGYIEEYYDNANSYEDAMPIPVAVGEDVVGIDLHLDKLGVIKGTVTNTAGEALSNVEIEFYFYNQDSDQWYQYNSTYSDSNGFYSMNIYPTRVYRLKFSDDLNEFYEFNNDVVSIEGAADIEVPLNQEVIVDAVLGNIKFGSISGFVTNSDNQPITDGSVSVTELGEGGQWYTVETTSIDSTGKYIFNRLQVNDYRLKVFSQGFITEFYDNASSIEQASAVSVDSGEVVQNIDFQLDKLGIIQGSITDELGQSLTNGVVTLYKKAEDRWVKFRDFYTYNSEYNFNLLPNGTYNLKFKNAEDYEYYNNVATLGNALDIEITLNDNKTINAVLGNIKTGTVSGKVTDKNENPISGVQVYLWRNESSRIYDENGWSLNYIYSYTDNDGNYGFDHIDADEFTIVADGLGYVNSSDTVSVVSGGSLQNIDFELDSEGKISGIVKDSNGQILQEARVTIYKIINDIWTPLYFTNVDNNGFYRFNYLATGTYRVSYLDIVKNIKQYSNGSKTLGAAVDIQIVPNQELTINYQFNNSSEVINRSELSKSVLMAKYGNDYIPSDALGTVYDDVNVNTFNAKWIEKLAADKLTEGCAIDRFCPDMLITKEQLAKILLKAKFGFDYSPPMPAGLFNDVPTSYLSAGYIEGMINQSYTEGCAANKFCPNEAVTVESFETILNRVFP